MSKSIEIAILLLLVVSAAAFLFIRPGAIWPRRPVVKNWLCYYGNRYGPESYSRFDLVAFDGTYHPPLVKNKNGKPIFLGYVSVGEVDSDGPLWHLAKDQSFLVKKNSFWNSWIVDVRDPLWHRILFEKAVPVVFARGFDGLFLDTFDSAIGLLYGEDAAQYEGVQTALADIIRKLRETYPDKYIAVNRGLPVLPHIADRIDFIVVENLYSYHSDDQKAYVRVDANTQNLLLRQLETGLKVNPDLVVLSIDYAEAHQSKLIQEAILFSRQKSFVPYISTITLDNIFYHALKP